MRHLRDLLIPLLGFALPAAAQISVLTSNYGLSRANANTQETVLSPTNVNTSDFGKLFSMPVDGPINAQPLYVPGLAFPDGMHNVLYVATMHNFIYAFDADSPGAPLWQVNLGPSVPASDYDFTDVVGDIGILSTPVIDPSSGTLYAVANTKTSGNYAYSIHALDLITGQEKFNGPATIQAVVPGSADGNPSNTVAFQAVNHLQRPALLLLNGTVYVSFGSHGDNHFWHGWILGYDAANLGQPTQAFNASPNGYGGAVWQSGRGIAVDSQGFLYVVTGNGDYDGIHNFGESLLKLDPSHGMAVVDSFTPGEWMDLNNHDSDFGSAGPILIPGTSLIVTGDKRGAVFVVDSTKMGGTQAGDTQIVQEFPAVSFGIFNMAFWQSSAGSYLYVRAFNDSLKSFRFANGIFETSPASVAPDVHSVPYDGMTISSNGEDAGSGILWLTAADTGDQPAPGVLRAYLATDLTRQIWNSAMNPLRDGLGNFAKFVNPVVANGKVYAATSSNQVSVYGELVSAAAPTISAVVNGASGVPGGVAPGEIVAIFGARLGPVALAGTQLTPAGNLSMSIAGVQVLFDGNPAPLLYASASQVGAVVPSGISSKSSTAVQVKYSGAMSESVAIPVVGASPGLFTANEAGTGQGAILNRDYSANSPQNPAHHGDTVLIYATGQGLFSPQPADGTLPVVSLLPIPRLPVTVTIGGANAEVEYAGAAPGFAGLMQINAIVPPGIATGNTAPVSIQVGDAPSQTGVTLAVQ